MLEEKDAQIALLQMQVDDLSFHLEREEELHRKANERVTASERRNKSLRSQIEALENQLLTLERCWNCPDLGNMEVCEKCTNNSVFLHQHGSYFWNDPKSRKKEGTP